MFGVFKTSLFTFIVMYYDLKVEIVAHITVFCVFLAFLLMS